MYGSNNSINGPRYRSPQPIQQGGPVNGQGQVRLLPHEAGMPNHLCFQETGHSSKHHRLLWTGCRGEGESRDVFDLNGQLNLSYRIKITGKSYGIQFKQLTKILGHSGVQKHLNDPDLDLMTQELPQLLEQVGFSQEEIAALKSKLTSDNSVEREEALRTLAWYACNENQEDPNHRVKMERCIRKLAHDSYKHKNTAWSYIRNIRFPKLDVAGKTFAGLFVGFAVAAAVLLVCGFFIVGASTVYLTPAAFLAFGLAAVAGVGGIFCLLAMLTAFCKDWQGPKEDVFPTDPPQTGVNHVHHHTHIWGSANQQIEEILSQEHMRGHRHLIDLISKELGIEAERLPELEKYKNSDPQTQEAFDNVEQLTQDDEDAIKDVLTEIERLLDDNPDQQTKNSLKTLDGIFEDKLNNVEQPIPPQAQTDSLDDRQRFEKLEDNCLRLYLASVARCYQNPTTITPEQQRDIDKNRDNHVRILVLLNRVYSGLEQDPNTPGVELPGIIEALDRYNYRSDVQTARGSDDFKRAVLLSRDRWLHFRNENNIPLTSGARTVSDAWQNYHDLNSLENRTRLLPPASPEQYAVLQDVVRPQVEARLSYLENQLQDPRHPQTVAQAYQYEADARKAELAWIGATLDANAHLFGVNPRNQGASGGDDDRGPGRNTPVMSSPTPPPGLMDRIGQLIQEAEDIEGDIVAGRGQYDDWDNAVRGPNGWQDRVRRLTRDCAADGQPLTDPENVMLDLHDCYLRALLANQNALQLDVDTPNLEDEIQQLQDQHDELSNFQQDVDQAANAHVNTEPHKTDARRTVIQAAAVLARLQQRLDALRQQREDAIRAQQRQPSPPPPPPPRPPRPDPVGPKPVTQPKRKPLQVGDGSDVLPQNARDLGRFLADFHIKYVADVSVRNEFDKMLLTKKLLAYFKLHPQVQSGSESDEIKKDLNVLQDILTEEAESSGRRAETVLAYLGIEPAASEEKAAENRQKQAALDKACSVFLWAYETKPPKPPAALNSQREYFDLCCAWLDKFLNVTQESGHVRAHGRFGMLRPALNSLMQLKRDYYSYRGTRSESKLEALDQAAQHINSVLEGFKPFLEDRPQLQIPQGRRALDTVSLRRPVRRPTFMNRQRLEAQAEEAEEQGAAGGN